MTAATEVAGSVKARLNDLRAQFTDQPASTIDAGDSTIGVDDTSEEIEAVPLDDGWEEIDLEARGLR